MQNPHFQRAAELEAARLEPDLLKALEALCAGVNAAPADRPLPAELQILRLDFEPYVPADARMLPRLLSFGLSTNRERPLRRPEGAPAAPGGGAAAGAPGGKASAAPEGNTAPLAGPGGTPTPTTAPATGAPSPAQGATSGQPQGASSGGTRK